MPHSFNPTQPPRRVFPVLASEGQGPFPQSMSMASVAGMFPLATERAVSASSNPICCASGQRFGVPLCVSLIAPALLVTVAFMVVLWQTTSATTSQSVDFLAGRVFDVVELQLAARVDVLTREMAAVSQMGAAAVLMDSSVASLQSYFYHVLASIKDPFIVGYSSTHGLHVEAMRLPSGELQVALRDPEQANVTEPELLYWAVNSQLQKLALASATPYNPLVRPWYTAVSSQNYTPAFSDSYEHVVLNNTLISLGVPVRSANGSVLGVVLVDYDLSTLQEAIQSAHQALRTSGMLLLL
eukprot:RCo017574